MPLVSVSSELDVVLEALRAVEGTLTAESNTLNALADDRELAADEDARLKELTKSLGRVRNRIILVNAAKLEQLDKGEQVQALRAKFQALQSELEEERKRLERLAGTIKDIGKGFEAAEKAIRKVGEKLVTGGLG
jgi:DNA repair exonuclease SbcCD ATPase subunit